MDALEDGGKANATSAIKKDESYNRRRLLHFSLYRRIFGRSSVLLSFAFSFCMLFGIALIANVQAAGEGTWFWYGFFLGGGKRLYADMHLALQPLYVLETRAAMAVLGKGWLASKIASLLHLVAYCIALLLLVRQSAVSDARKAILLVCSFFVSISFEAYQFSDYHVLADCFVLYSLVALLSLSASTSVRRTLGLAAILGALSGLTLTTRLNDGAALFAGVFLAVMCLAPLKKVLSLLLFCLTTAITLVFIVLLTGDSLRDYAMYSIFKSAGSKGGAGSVLAQPLGLPWNTFKWLIDSFPRLISLSAFVLALIAAFLIRHFRRSEWWIRGLAGIGFVLILFQAHQMGLFKNITLLSEVAGFFVLLASGLGVWVVARFLLWLFFPSYADGWDRREILLLIPLGQLASGSMSSGGTHLGLYGPVGVIIVLLAIVSPIRFKVEWPRDILFGLAVLLVLCTVTFRFNNPYSWLTYTQRPMFTDRIWYRHPDYGPMIIDRDLLRMITPVCQKIREGGSDEELLSMPFPYANYFCSIPPWRGHVQTFFDTTSKQTIQCLTEELRRSPPKWILYQRQLNALRLHEVQFNHGNALPHRYLDQLIEQKIDQGVWRVVHMSDFGNSPRWDNKWILIQTR